MEHAQIGAVVDGAIARADLVHDHAHFFPHGQVLGVRGDDAIAEQAHALARQGGVVVVEPRAVHQVHQIHVGREPGAIDGVQQAPDVGG